MMSLLLVVLLVPSSVPKQPMKNIFVLGDSISIQYGPYLEENLRGIFHYDRKRDDAGVSDLGVPSDANGGDSRMALEYLRARQKDPSFRPDILLVNCGLHDIKRNLEKNQSLQVEPEQYRKNLEGIYFISLDLGARLIWVRTTPVVDAIHNASSREFHRYERDLARYNEIADSVFENFNVPIVDLNHFTEGLGDESFIDHVHYDERARALQAAFIAGFLQNFR